MVQDVISLLKCQEKPPFSVEEGGSCALNRRWCVWCLLSPVTLFLSLDLVPDGVVDMRGLLMEVVQNSSHGWDYVLEGIVQFGFSLMEGYSPRSVTSAVPFGDLGCIDRLVCDTGAAVVLRTYEVRKTTAIAASSSAVPCPIRTLCTAITHMIKIL